MTLPLEEKNVSEWSVIGLYKEREAEEWKKQQKNEVARIAETGLRTKIKYGHWKK